MPDFDLAGESENGQRDDQKAVGCLACLDQPNAVNAVGNDPAD